MWCDDTLVAVNMWDNKRYFYEDALDVKLETLFSWSGGNQVIVHPYITQDEEGEFLKPGCMECVEKSIKHLCLVKCTHFCICGCRVCMRLCLKRSH